MRRSVKEIIGYKVGVYDEENIGKLDDLYFDDDTWRVQYFVIDIGSWLEDRRVLVTPKKVKEPDWANKVVPMSLNKLEIDNCPGIREDLPVSLQDQINVSQYEIWSPGWNPHATPLTGALLHNEKKAKRLTQAEMNPSGNSHLRSVEELLNYSIAAKDGSIGHVKDFIVDTEDWTIRYIVVETGILFLGKKVLVPTDWIVGVDWAKEDVNADVLCAEIKDAPIFDPNKPINREHEVCLYDYYGRPCYWQKPV